jgi:hypothetical protein
LRRALIFAVTPILLWVGSALVAGPILHAERQHPLASLEAFDIVGIGRQSGENLLPGTWTAAEAAQIEQCYKPDKWDSISGGACAFVPDNLDAQKNWGTPVLTQAWVGAILAHPGAYLLHRMAYMNELLRWLGPIPEQDSFMESEMQDVRYAHFPGGLFRAFERTTNALAASPLFRPYFWLILSLVLCALGYCATPSPSVAIARALSLSGALYLLTYAVVGVGSDFRYAYWTIVSVLLAAMALTGATWRRPAYAQLAMLAGGGSLALAVIASVAL